MSKLVDETGLNPGGATAVVGSNPPARTKRPCKEMNAVKFTPYEKMSKRDRRKVDSLRRNTWTINPVTRKPKNPKAYDRRKERKRMDSECDFPSFLLQNPRK